jgi:hypothetical protein
LRPRDYAVDRGSCVHAWAAMGASRLEALRDQLLQVLPVLQVALIQVHR